MEVNSKRITEKLTFKEKKQTVFRLIKEIRILAPKFITATIARQFFSVAAGYIGIYISTMVVGKLETGISARKMIPEVLIWLTAGFFIYILTGKLSNECEVIKSHSWELLDIRMAVKNMEMNYPDLDSPYTNELYRRMEEDNRWGNGIYGGFLHFEKLCFNMINALFAIVLLAPIFYGLFINGGALTYVFFGVLVAAVIVNGIGDYYFGKKLTEYMALWTDDKPEDTNLMWYYAVYEGVSMENRKYVKIYDAVKLLKEYTFNHGREFLKYKNDLMAKACGRQQLVINVLNIGIRGICYLFLTLIAAGGGIAAGMLLRYVACFERLTNSVQDILNSAQAFLLVARRQSTMFEFLDTQGSFYEGKLPVEKRSDNEYEVEFQNVSFKYPGSDEYALRNFSLKLRIGERMAVVGKNGSGKTTMIKLLCRLYEPTEGIICLNGIDIRKYDYNEYMQLFSVVFQKFSLFDYSIAENVASGEDFDAGKVKECLIKAGFGERLAGLEKGITTCVDKGFDDDGVMFSGGERQKIALARALYKNSPFILLDEPTAALDPVAEYEVYSAFDAIVGSRTAVYISHRLSSCRFCDDIIVFDRGRIVQRGSHEELMKDKPGLYFSLWTAQAQYYGSAD
ncbi:MAG: ABC transporter ATP-binding protein [Lachnospiraceae bacterium]|nr:ABC transporter ATP-binding protein [Lachnospiraceae bacterium]